MADFPFASGSDPASGSNPGLSPSAGWYPDPEQPGLLRWWDGGNWTHERVDPRPTEPGGGRRVAILLGIVAFLGLVGLGVYVADRLRTDDPVVAASSETEGTAGEAESGSTSSSEVPEPPARRDIEVGGQPLPPMSDSDDAVIGLPAPTLRGFDLAGNPMAILDDGRPKAIYFLAHWCPHCQVELPKLVDLVEGGALPAELDIYLVSTAVDGTRGNYPPSAWFEAEGWPDPVLDDEVSAAAFRAFGGTGFPFAVYVGADNTVVMRLAGETPPDIIVEMWTITALTG